MKDRQNEMIKSDVMRNFATWYFNIQLSCSTRLKNFACKLLSFLLNDPKHWFRFRHFPSLPTPWWLPLLLHLFRPIWIHLLANRLQALLQPRIHPVSFRWTFLIDWKILLERPSALPAGNDARSSLLDELRKRQELRKVILHIFCHCEESPHDSDERSRCAIEAS